MTPETMTGADVIAIVKARGFSLRLDSGPPPMPILRDPGGHIPAPSDTLLDALRAFRDEILVELAKEPCT